MSVSLDWRPGLSPGIRFLNVQKIQRAVQITGEVSKNNAQKAAFAAETEAFNNSTSRLLLQPIISYAASVGTSIIAIRGRLFSSPLSYLQDQYDSACSALSAKATVEPVSQHQPAGSDIVIGKYLDCFHVANGVLSEVYRSQLVALKVITETREVQPHSPSREVRILIQLSHGSIIKLIETFKDQHGRLVLVFPYMPLTLANVLSSQKHDQAKVFSYFKDLLSALDYLHEQGIIHRDVKPSNLLLESVSGPAYLADFGTAWHPTFSLSDEPVDHKVLDVGTTSYRTPEALFGKRSYDTSLDIWAVGTMLAECLRSPPKPLFESRGSSEDGNQLGLILSIFKTLGTPTKESWPEAVHFSTPLFEWYQSFPGHSWEELLPDATNDLRDVVARMVCYQTTERLTAKAAAKLIAQIG